MFAFEKSTFFFQKRNEKSLLSRATCKTFSYKNKGQIVLYCAGQNQWLSTPVEISL
jgi:hypothetical protein